MLATLSVAHLNLLGLRLVLGLEAFCLGNHALDILLRKAALLVGDRDLVFLAGRLLNGRHVQDAVCVNVKRHLNLRNTAGHRRDAIKVELAHELVVLQRTARGGGCEHV
jgi:hypothetical protein